MILNSKRLLNSKKTFTTYMWSIEKGRVVLVSYRTQNYAEAKEPWVLRPLSWTMLCFTAGHAHLLFWLILRYLFDCILHVYVKCRWQMLIMHGPPNVYLVLILYTSSQGIIFHQFFIFTLKGLDGFTVRKVKVEVSDHDLTCILLSEIKHAIILFIIDVWYGFHKL